MFAMREDEALDVRAAAPKFFGDIGLDCGPGWGTILKALGSHIEFFDPDVRALQIKEKFGELRVYVGAAEENTLKAIDAATVESRKICERCGGLGTWRGDGWARTLCDRCEAERKAGA